MDPTTKELLSIVTDSVYLFVAFIAGVYLGYLIGVKDGNGF